MTTTLRTHHPDIDQRGKDTMEVIDRLLHEIQNNLQVIRMEAELWLIDGTSKREPRGAFDAAQNIERVLGEMRQYFLLLR